MDLTTWIAPTGIISFALFVFALVNGIPRLGLSRWHAVTGYACCAVVLVHSAAALLSHIFEPLGVLATIGMLLTTASGYFRWKTWLHVALAIFTLLFSVLHVIYVVA